MMRLFRGASPGVPLFILPATDMILGFDPSARRGYISPTMQAPAAKLDIRITPEWKQVSKNRGHPFHPLCGYMALFPPQLPHYFIQSFTSPGHCPAVDQLPVPWDS